MSIIRLPYLSSCLIVLLAVLSSCAQGSDSKNNFDVNRLSLQDSINKINLSIKKIRNDSNSLQTTLEQSLSSNDKINQLVLYRSLGDLHLKNFHFTSAIKNHGEYLKLSEELADSLQILKALNVLSIDYRKAYQMDNAIRYSFRARKTADNLQNSDSIVLREKALSLNGISWIYSMLEYPGLQKANLERLSTGKASIHSSSNR